MNRLNNKGLKKYEYMPTFDDLIAVEYNSVKGLKNTVK